MSLPAILVLPATNTSSYVLYSSEPLDNPDILTVIDIRFLTSGKVSEEVIETAHETRSLATQHFELAWLVEEIDNFIEMSETTLRK